MNDSQQIEATGKQEAPELPPRDRSGRPRRRKRWRVLSWLLFILFDIVVLLGLGLFLASQLLDGRDLPAPDWTAAEASRFLSRGLGGGTAEVGAITVQVSKNALPKVVFREVTVTAPSGVTLVAVPALEVALDKKALAHGRPQPRAFAVEGASIELRRKEDGAFDFGFSSSEAPAAFASLDEAIAAIQNVFDLPGLAPVERIELKNLQVFYEDARARRAWRVSDGRLLLTNDANDISLAVSLDLPESDAGSETPSSVALRLSIHKSETRAEASALVENVAAADIAAHSPALSWLEPLQARVSGAVIVGTTAEGKMGPLDGTLEIGPGTFQPDTAAHPIRFDGAQTYFSYRPDEGRITFEQLDIHAPDGTITATGHSYLEGIETGWPTAMVSQFAFTDFRIDPPGLLRQPAHFDQGAVDLKVTLDPFEAKIGQMVMRTAEAGDDVAPTELRGAGKITANETGWHVALDLGFDRVTAGPLINLWPLDLVPRTRQWIENHLISGEVFDARAGLTLNQGQRPDIAMSFQFRDSVLKPMKTLPPIENASGYAAIGRYRFAITLEEGDVTAPEGGEIDMSGSTFRVMDMKQKPSIAELLWQSDSSVTAALSVLDLEPFRFLSKAGQPVDLAQGQARIDGRITFPMKDGMTGDDVGFEITGVARDVASDSVVPGRSLASERVTFRTDRKGLELEGAATLDGVPHEARFVLPFGEGNAPPSVEGTVEIGERFVKTFGIGLPDGSVSGAGPANFSLSLPGGEAPRYRLQSNLRGVSLSLPPLGWSKPTNAEGSLVLSGRLGARPNVEKLSLKGGGLSAEGRVSTTAEGGLDEAVFSRVAVGDWLDAPVLLKGRGAGRDPAIAVRGGRIDIRKTSMGGASGGSGSGPPVSLVLDRLTISDNIALRDFRGELTKAGGYSGQFTGAVNGQARVSGTLVPGKRGGTAVRIRSDNAGAVFKSAGLFKQANGGAMSLILQPTGRPGEYDGQLQVDNVRLRSASGLTALVNAISVVGLIDELNGAGILFTDVEALFRLTPNYVHVTRSSGTGPSLGISMEGVYDMVNDRLNMQGVFSPVYMVNAIGSIFTRKGEGLVGFTYTMRGSSSDPQVAVNPLSAFTPGMFREIFRAPPPKPQGGG